MDSFIDQKCTFWKCAKKLGRALPPTLIWTKSKRKHYFLRPVNSWLLHFHLCMSGKFSPSSWPFTSDEDQSRKNPGGDSQSCRCLWLDEGKWSGQLQHVRLLPAFSSTMSAWRCIARQVNLGLQTRAHNLCHDNRLLIVIAINRNHSASKIDCN